MTAIAMLQLDDEVAFISDLLGTRDGHAGMPYVPTVGDQHMAILGPNRVVAGLFQKTAIIRPNLCLALAGRGDIAIRFAAHLDGALPGAPDEEALDQAIDAFPIADLTEIHYIAALLSAGRPIIRKTHRLDRHPSGDFEGIFAGSGAAALLDYFQFTGRSPRDALPAAKQIYYRALSCVALAMTRQVHDGLGIDRGWGGGFEVISIVDGVFQRRGGIITNFITLTEVGDGLVDLYQIPIYIHQTYYGRYLRMLRGSQVGLGRTEHLVSPMLPRADDPPPPGPGMLPDIRDRQVRTYAAKITRIDQSDAYVTFSLIGENAFLNFTPGVDEHLPNPERHARNILRHLTDLYQLRNFNLDDRFLGPDGDTSDRLVLGMLPTP